MQTPELIAALSRATHPDTPDNHDQSSRLNKLGITTILQEEAKHPHIECQRAQVIEKRKPSALVNRYCTTESDG